jgi:hypothetical protein
MEDGKIKVGNYKGRCVKDETVPDDTESPRLLVMVNIPELKRQFTVPLYFTEAAAPHSFSRLRACGWTGADLSDLTGIDANEIDVKVFYEVWTEAKGGDNKERLKVEILSGGGGGGVFKPKAPTDLKAFATKVAALTGTPAPTGAPKPTF